MATSIVPITTLSPTSAPPANAAIRAVVTLIWPYSSSTKQCALLLADPDFRLRNKKGQVRVRFSGPSAEAVALGKLGIGDEILLELKGAAWVESSENAVRTPGRSVDGELVYEGQVGIQKTNGDWIRADQSERPPVEESMQTPVARNEGRLGSLRSSVGTVIGAVPIYSSPAFVRISRLSGDGFGDGFDPFTGELEDLEADGPRKRARISFGGTGKWRLAGRSPSPEKDAQVVREDSYGHQTDADVEMTGQTAIIQDSVDADDRGKADTPPALDLAASLGMAPPALSRLHMPDLSFTSPTETRDGPSTPNLRPVPSSTLPLPSPFPIEPQAEDPATATQGAANFSAAASISQPSLTLSLSLPDTADPDDDASLIDIYAHNGATDETHHEHAPPPHPEYLSDTEEDEDMYEEHMRNMRAEGLRDEYNYNDDNDNDDRNDEQEVDADDVEELIEDMGEEPEDSSDEDVQDGEAEGRSAMPVVPETNNDQSARHKPAPSALQQMSLATIPAQMGETTQNAARLPSGDRDGGNPLADRLLESTAKFPAMPSDSSMTVPQKRKFSVPTMAAPYTPTKIFAATTGMDGTSNTPQITPQSERERIMARTYSSLFGFADSPAPLQSFAKTPTPAPSGVVADMGRVNTGAGVVPGGGNETKQSSDDDPGTVATTEPTPAVLPPRIGASGIDESDVHDLPSSPSHDPFEVRFNATTQDSQVARETSPTELDAQGINPEDVTMSNASSTQSVTQHDSFQADVGGGRPASREAASAAILEAAIEGGVDMDAGNAATLDGGNHADDDVIIADLVEAAVSNDALAIPVVAPSASQIEVIDLDSGGEEEELDDASQHAPHTFRGASASPHSAIDTPAFQETPTEVGSDDEDADLKHQESTKPQSPATAEPDGVKAVQDPKARVISETLQTQDAQSILPDENEQETTFFAEQMPALEEPHTPAVQPKSNLSFNYFSFQSTTSAASESFAEDRQSTPKDDAAERTGEMQVIELLSSSPAAGIDDSPSAHTVVEPADITAHAMEGDAQSTDDESFSPELFRKQHASTNARTSPIEVAAGDQYGQIIARDDQYTSEAERASIVANDDDQIADAEVFSPEVSRAQHASLESPEVKSHDMTSARDAQSIIGDLRQHQSELLVEMHDASPPPTLPPSPDDSQTQWETQLAPSIPPSHNVAFPPNPQPTQPDSLISDAKVVVEPAEPAATPSDPPSRHTRSSVDPTVVQPAQPRQITPDPPFKNTRSSAEPTADKQLRSATQKTPARRSTRLSQTHSQISEKLVDERHTERQEGEDTIAVLSPLQKTPVRKVFKKTSKVAAKAAEMTETEEGLHKRSPAKKSFASRLGNVPEVISEWFSPRRSTRLHPDEEEVEADIAQKSGQRAFVGLSTAMGYYTALSNLSQRINSQARADNTVDIIAIVADATKEPERAKAGPKDYFTFFKVWDNSLGTDEPVLVEVLRPWKATLPLAEVGDVILLRGFSVKSRKRQPYLISSEASGWCVWRYAEHEGLGARQGKQRAMSFSGIREEIKGPPVELGQEERDRVQELKEAWEKLNEV